MVTLQEVIPELINAPIRTNDENWSATKTLLACSIVLAVYLTLVKKMLPDYMKDRPAFPLKTFLKGYNLVQVLFNLYVVILYTRYMLKYGVITTRCPTDKASRLEIIGSHVWPYFIAKHLDLVDTVVMVLRKKTAQVSFLHVYHHCVMITWSWLLLCYFPTDQFAFGGHLNSTVHVIMYTYYGLSTMGPAFEKYLWWKKHLTKVQLVQFILGLVQMHYQRKASPCPVPAAFHYFCLFNVAFFFVLFLQFYFRSYRKGSNDKGSSNSNGKSKDD